MTTLIIAGHPDLTSSRLSAALVDAARDLPDVAVRILAEVGLPAHRSAVGATPVFDVEAEQRALSEADRIVLLYPTYWYSTPGLLKMWMDQVFARGWAYGTGRPGALAGKTLTVVTTTGGAEAAYRPGELHSAEYDTILTPLKATAHRLGMLWGEPLVVHGVREVDDEQLAAVARRFGALVTGATADALLV